MEVLEARFLLAGLDAEYLVPLPAPDPVPSPDISLSAWIIRVGAAHGVPSDRYENVPDAKAPHDTLANAQHLPDVPFLGIVGTFGPNDGTELFRVPIDPNTLGLQFRLRTGPSAAGRLWLFDESGHVLSDWTMTDGRGTLTVGLGLAGPSAGSAIFIGISPAGPNGPGAPPPSAGYQLWVSRQTATDPPRDGVGVAVLSPSIPSGPPVTSTVDVRSNPPSPMIPGASVGDGFSRLAPSQLVPRVTATGPMPTRSAGPSGGVLTDGDPTPPISRLGPATVVLDSLETLPRKPTEDPWGVAPSTEDTDQVDAASALVTLPGPGGFPLLGAALVGDWRGAPDPAGTDPLRGLDSGGEIAVMTTVVAEEDSPAEAADRLERPREDRHASIRSGLSLAAAFSFSILLFDPATLFQCVALLGLPTDPELRGDSGLDKRRRPDGHTGSSHP